MLNIFVETIIHYYLKVWGKQDKDKYIYSERMQ